MERWSERLLPKEERRPASVFLLATAVWIALSGGTVHSAQAEFWRAEAAAWCAGWVVGSLGLFAAAGLFFRFRPRHAHLRECLRDLGALFAICVVLPVAAAMTRVPHPSGVLLSAGFGLYWAGRRVFRNPD